MARKTKEQVIAELEIKQIPYSTDMSYDELCALNKDKTGVIVDAITPKELVFKEVPNGVATANDHERRITILEDLVCRLQVK